MISIVTVTAPTTPNASTNAIITMDALVRASRDELTIFDIKKACTL
jgi:hypothetical protein